MTMTNSGASFEDAVPSSDARNRSMGSAVAPLASTKRIIDALEGMFRLQGTRHQGQICAIVGASHVGKSTAQKAFMKQKAAQLGGITENVETGKAALSRVANVSYVTVMDDGQMTHPVVRIQILENPTFNALADNTLRALVRGNPPKWKNADDLAALLHEQLTGKKVRLVIYDDVQELAKVFGTQKNRAVTLFKSLCKVANVEVAAVGIEGTLQVLTSDPQVAKLITKRVLLKPLPRPNWKLPEESLAAIEFVRFLRFMKQKAPFDAESPLDDPAVGDALWVYSKGIIGDVKALLQAATDYAIQANRPCIDRLTLRDVLRYGMDFDDQHNPFVLTRDS